MYAPYLYFACWFASASADLMMTAQLQACYLGPFQSFDRREGVRQLCKSFWQHGNRCGPSAAKAPRIRQNSLRGARFQLPLLQSSTERLVQAVAYLRGKTGHLFRVTLDMLTPQHKMIALIFMAFLVGCVFGFMSGSYRSIKNEFDITGSDVKRQRTLEGVVVDVADDYTILVRHRPWWIRWRPLPKAPSLVCSCGNFFMDDAAFCRKCGKKRPDWHAEAARKQADESISVRIFAVVEPEMSLEVQTGLGVDQRVRNFMAAQMLNRRVAVKVLDRDEQARIVASVTYGIWPFAENLSKKLLKEGFAAVDRQVETDRLTGVFEDLEKTARSQKKGVWAQLKSKSLPSKSKPTRRC